MACFKRQKFIANHYSINNSYRKYETNKPAVFESLPTQVVTSRCIDVRAVWPSRDILDIELGPSRTITREPLFIYNPIDWSFLFLTCVALCNIINNNEGPFRLRLCRQLLFDLFYLYVCVYVCMYMWGDICEWILLTVMLLRSTIKY